MFQIISNGSRIGIFLVQISILLETDDLLCIQWITTTFFNINNLKSLMKRFRIFLFLLFFIMGSSSPVQVKSQTYTNTTDNGTQWELDVVIDKNTFDENDINFLILVKITLGSLSTARDIHDITLFCKIESGTYLFEDTAQFFVRETDSLLFSGDSKAYSFSVDLSKVAQTSLSIYTKASFREDISGEADPLISTPYINAHELTKYIKESDEGFISVNPINLYAVFIVGLIFRGKRK